MSPIITVIKSHIMTDPLDVAYRKTHGVNICNHNKDSEHNLNVRRDSCYERVRTGDVNARCHRRGVQSIRRVAGTSSVNRRLLLLVIGVLHNF